MSSHRPTAGGHKSCVIHLHWNCVKDGCQNPAYSGIVISGDHPHDMVVQGSRLTELLAIQSKVFWCKASWDVMWFMLTSAIRGY